jgi:membrane protein implicated in regulation of membrane protease activity
MEGESATVTEEIPAEGVGKVELRGSSWNARTASGTIPRGQRCLVERVEGLTVWVRPE